METDHAAACRYFTPGDACRIVLAAYRAAAFDLAQPPGEPWMIDGEPYAGPSDFADSFVGEVAARLGLLALERLGAFLPPSGQFDPFVIASRAAPEKMREIISVRETELAQSMHDLHVGENARHNAATEGDSAYAGG